MRTGSGERWGSDYACLGTANHRHAQWKAYWRRACRVKSAETFLNAVVFDELCQERHFYHPERYQSYVGQRTYYSERQTEYRYDFEYS